MSTIPNLVGRIVVARDVGDATDEPVDGRDGVEEPVATPSDAADDVDESEGEDAPESDGSANATPGQVATDTPTPTATAAPPNRDTYFIDSIAITFRV